MQYFQTACNFFIMFCLIFTIIIGGFIFLFSSKLIHRHCCVCNPSIIHMVLVFCALGLGIHIVCPISPILISLGGCNIFNHWRAYCFEKTFRDSHLSILDTEMTHIVESLPRERQGPTYSISQEICTRFCCALLDCGYAIVHNEFTWSIYPYSSGLLCWHWGNR